MLRDYAVTHDGKQGDGMEVTMLIVERALSPISATEQLPRYGAWGAEGFEEEEVSRCRVKT